MNGEVNSTDNVSSLCRHLNDNKIAKYEKNILLQLIFIDGEVIMMWITFKMNRKNGK